MNHQQELQYIEDTFPHLINKIAKETYNEHTFEQNLVEHNDFVNDIWVSILKAKESFTRIHGKSVTSPDFTKYLGSVVYNVKNTDGLKQKSRRTKFSDPTCKDIPTYDPELNTTEWFTEHIVPTNARVDYPELTGKAADIYFRLLEAPDFLDNPDSYIKQSSGKLNCAKVGELLNISERTVQRAFKS